jgi:hypothetical protein
MKKQWTSLDFFTRQTVNDVYLWLALEDIRGSLVIPSSLESPSDEVQVDSMATLNREVAVMICNEKDFHYVRNRSKSRPILLVNDDQVKVFTSEGVDAILPRNPEAIQEFFISKNPPIRRVDEVNRESIGILYMCFGKKAAKEVAKSIKSLRETGLQFLFA